MSNLELVADAPDPALPGAEASSVARLRQRIGELEHKCEEYRIIDETADAIPFRLLPDLTRFTYVGPQADRLLGIPRARWLEAGFFEARLSPEERIATLEQFRLVVEFGAENETEFRIHRDDGSWTWLRCTMRLVESATGAVLAGHLLDISMRRMLESDRSQLLKLEAVGRLAAGLAHEINTPVQFVGDSVSFVREGLTDVLHVLARYRAAASALPAEHASALAALEHDVDLDFLVENMPDALGRAADGLTRVATLVSSMKTFAAPELQEKARADLNSALEATIAISASHYRLVADVETDFGQLPPCACYISELNQAFLNIFINAAHAIGDTGRRGKIRVTTRADGCDIVVSISDTGTGIAPQVASRIFEPFFTTKPVGKGAGQGLSVARAIVDKHDGSLTFETTPGVGTIFSIRLPVG